MDTIQRNRMIELTSIDSADILVIFSSDPTLHEWLSTEIEKIHPVKKKDMQYRRLYLHFEKPAGGWNAPAYACGMAVDDSIILLLDNGWEPFFYEERSGGSGRITKYIFRK